MLLRQNRRKYNIYSPERILKYAKAVCIIRTVRLSPVRMGPLGKPPALPSTSAPQEPMTLPSHPSTLRTPTPVYTIRVWSTLVVCNLNCHCFTTGKPTRSFATERVLYTPWMKEVKGIRHGGGGAYLHCPVFTTVQFSLRDEGSSEYIRVCVKGEKA